MQLRLAARAMATRFELVLPLALNGEDEPHCRAAGEEALREITDCDQRLSRFERSSLISHVNRCAATDWIRLDRDTFELLETCDEVWHASSGAFDATVNSARGASWRNVELDEERNAVRFTDARVALDLGAIGKGHAIDLAMACLRDAGIERALLHGGTSTVATIGDYDVAIGNGPEAPIARLASCALSVSSPAGQRLPGGGGHILDPKTGRSVPDRLAAVCAPSARFADAWSTALVVARELPSRVGVETLIGDGAWHHAGDGSRFTVLEKTSTGIHS